MSNFVKTAKGTELPVMNLKGKRYLQVNQRLVWFVEENPFYDIQTNVKMLTDDCAFCTAVIQVLKPNEDPTKGLLVVKRVTATKVEDRKGFSDFIEKSETGSIGRALALLGYGTQFTGDEFNEGNTRIVDAPIENRSAVTTKPNNNPFNRQNNMKPVVRTQDGE
jgi:hypothetical protein